MRSAGGRPRSTTTCSRHRWSTHGEGGEKHGARKVQAAGAGEAAGGKSGGEPVDEPALGDLAVVAAGLGPAGPGARPGLAGRRHAAAAAGADAPGSGVQE